MNTPPITEAMNELVKIFFNSSFHSTWPTTFLVTRIGSTPKLIKIPATSNVTILTACAAPTIDMYSGKATFPPSQVTSR